VISGNIMPDLWSYLRAISFYLLTKNCPVQRDQYNDNMGYIPLRSKKGFVEVSLEDFEQYPFIVNELNLEIEKIKTEGQELIQVFS